MKLQKLITVMVLGGLIALSCKPKKEEKKESSIQTTTTKVVYNALEDFEFKADDNSVPFYRDSVRNALAINAVDYKGVFSSATVKFTGESGNYDVKFTSLMELDGESTYKIIVNGKEIGAFQNPETTIDYEVNTYTLENVQLEKGQDITIKFNSHSNDKIPEGDGFAYSRGRWTGIEFQSVH
ncbi:hypothetical protein JQC67_06950 [Aurantibacter crassamenti]|uniref:hypothetical protein n=1 Tax=Aurantibacter crassamenti TaxID=1837375 RepID=UPI00193A7291|nr:hypothetical protein [Aurantibacter crassamenti]MBM1105868.1 hypothetical protein [Aurantibacter crassamenti]